MSGGATPVTGKYVGTGSATKFYVPCGFVPKSIEVISASGAATWREGMPGAIKQINGGANALLAADAVQPERTDASGNPFLGFSVSSTDASLNSSSVNYYWKAE